MQAVDLSTRKVLGLHLADEPRAGDLREPSATVAAFRGGLETSICVYLGGLFAVVIMWKEDAIFKTEYMFFGLFLTGMYWLS